MNIKRNISLAAIFAATLTHAAWAFDLRSDSTTICLYDINVDVDEAKRTVGMNIELDTKAFKVGRDRQMILTPVLIADNGSDSLSLNPIIVAGRNQWYHYLRSGILDDGSAPIYRSGKAGKAVYAATVALEPWMEKSTLEMRVATANCCDAPEVMPGPSANGMVPMAHIGVSRPELQADFIFAPPVDARPVEKNIEGSAFVTFVVNRTELKENYMNNRKELDKIINSIEYVRRDTDATITGVHIKGFASPEGPYDNNVRLAKGRTETLRRYVRDLYRFADSTVTSSYEPEDWGGLRTYMTDSLQFTIAHRAEIIDIIDGPLGFDNKNLAIQTRFPADYSVILKDIYPWLRHSDYTVKYRIKVYTSIDDIRRAYATDPTRLRTVDFYTLARTFDEGSTPYCDVFETAVRVYPDDPMLNLNAANIDLMHGRLDEAQSHLLKAGHTPLAYYARGILAAKRGDLNEALRMLTQARDNGLPEAAETIDRVEALRSYHPVDYLIRGSKTTE